MPKEKVLIVLTSHNKLGKTGKKTGFHYEELTTPYFVLKEEGLDVTLASIEGGKPPHDPGSLKKDADDCPESVCKFLGDEDAKKALEETVSINDIKAEDFDALYLPGGHGVMWDFVNNKQLQNLVSSFYKSGKPIAAICHGVVGLIGATDEDGEEIVKDKRINSFTDAEEKEIGLDDVVPFLLESKLRDLGARFEYSDKFQAHISQNDNLVTGQNPASAEGVADLLITLIKEKRTRVA